MMDAQGVEILVSFRQNSLVVDAQERGNEWELIDYEEPVADLENLAESIETDEDIPIFTVMHRSYGMELIAAMDEGVASAFFGSDPVDEDEVIDLPAGMDLGGGVELSGSKNVLCRRLVALVFQPLIIPSLAGGIVIAFPRGPLGHLSFKDLPIFQKWKAMVSHAPVQRETALPEREALTRKKKLMELTCFSEKVKVEPKVGPQNGRFQQPDAPEQPGPAGPPESEIFDMSHDPLRRAPGLEDYQGDVPGPRCLVADSIAAGRGVPQGCPLSPSLTKLTMSELLRLVSSLSFVSHVDLWLDDVSLDIIGEDPVAVASAALDAYRSLHASLGLEGLEVEATKTKFIAGSSRAKAALNQLRRPAEPETADLVKDLGRPDGN
ncbi:hypothetical protein AK812_SmicGene43110 [Symbiodinium microadriaticum]|uniref:Reverse transcriptase domain-containing protein n=1 Tax=Symbiodinium microadriaticum TaxID=2951 RepID=A0A1Q9C1V2_SYMMI|nr:hypothetical protein AK812_SmicGene43110 [Symbiodinium microadriaticum]